MEKHRMLLAGIVVVALLVTVFFSKPSITGYLPTETISQGINLNVAQSQRFYLESDEVISLRGLSLTGKIEGKGLFKAYLFNPTTGKRFLIVSNDKPSGGGLSSITGLATINVVPGERLDVIETGPALMLSLRNLVLGFGLIVHRRVEAKAGRRQYARNQSGDYDLKDRKTPATSESLYI